ncbi:hypothetical protein AWB69_00012 [Caballeronia udeis]|uniref:Uncharacterized protein n=1 Tax=Caballeronia udeis TaxID=1232866 RepID=A0A158EP60_9BURK|nr:hypothetical protein [Caballeronia udeis]SAL09276.1 hypothetical protein AWB69_00012 [Caballeronia udeis]
MTAAQLLSIILTFVVAGGGAYFGSYFREKGKNRATSEDIRGLTRAVEDIKSESARQLAELAHQNSVLIEHLKSRQQLRIAALDKRLQAHQEAFTLWRRLMAAVHSDNVGEMVAECQTWWERNSLYLEPEVREAFNRAYFAAAGHKGLLEVGRRSDANLKAVQDNWQLILSTGNVIMNAVELPPLNEQEQSTTL